MGMSVNFDAEQVSPRTFSPVPPGEYEIIIVDSGEKDTKDGSGAYCELDLQIVSGDHKGRNLKDRLNLRNKSDQAVGIARATLSAICHATGVLKLVDTAQLHNIPMLVKIKLNKEGTYNEVVGYKSMPQQSNQQAQNGNGQAKTLPWKTNS